MGDVSTKRIILLAMAAASLGWGQQATTISTTISTPASSLGNTYAYGNTTTLTAVVTPVLRTSSFITGTVLFLDGNARIGAVTIAAYTASPVTVTCAAVLLTGGTHTITAQYSGDVNFSPSVSATSLTVTVTPATPTLVLVGSTFSAIYGGTLSAGTLTVNTAVDVTGAPTGTVTVASGNLSFAGNFRLAGGVATVTGAQLPTTLAPGVGKTLTFSYSGDGNYAAASTSGLITVNPATPAMTLVSSQNPSALNQPVTFTAAVTTPTTGAPTGTIAFKDGTTVLVSGVQIAGGIATLTTSTLTPAPPATHTITAVYSGDTNFAANTSYAVNQFVNSIALTPSNSSPSVNTTVTYSVTLTGGSTPPQGSVSINDGGTTVCSIAAVTAGAASSTGSCTVTYNNADAQHGAGAHSITAVFTPANSNWAAVTSAVSTVTVGSATTVTSLTSNQTSIRVGGSVTYTASVQGAPVAAGNPTGTVTFYDASITPIPGCSGLAVTAANPAVATCSKTYDGSVPVLGSGNHQITAVFTHAGLIFPDSSSSQVALTVVPALAITTTSLPSGTSGSSYSFTLAGRGGTPPYTWSASGLPPSLFVNPATGVISGAIQTSGTFLITVGLRDAASPPATAQFQLVVSPPPVSIAPSSSLPSGIVGAAYTGFVFADGGNGDFRFSLGSGSLPDGLTLSSGGAISGTPKTPGQFTFSVVATDSAGASGFQDFRITIQPAPLNITGGPTTPTVPTGTPISISFTGTGGVGPYRFTLCGSLPPGTTFSNGVLSGTPTTPGTFTVCVTIADSTGAVFTKNFALTVAPPAALSLSGSLSDAKVGVPYAGQISAAGGAGPYSYAGSGLPDGLSLSASGSISGTPGTAGQFSFTATATDSTGAKANGTFRITIVPADLSIVTASLPDGVVGVAYSASLTASGGVPPYKWTVTGLPDGVTATAAGAISGTPTKAGSFTVIVSVTDAAGTSIAPARRPSPVTIAPAPLAITTASAPNGTVGTAYSASFAASGGTAPLTFSASGLPAGLSMSAAGAVSGTPTAAGPATIVVTVKDAAGASTSKSFPVTIGLPSTPPLNLTVAGVSDTASPLQQPRLQVTLGNSFPVDVVVTLTLSFAPDSGADDPAIQFSGGGRTASITVPAGATTGSTDIGVQTGSVAGLIAITAQMQATGQDVTPTPVPRRTIRVAAAAPVIVPGTLTAVRNSTGFTVTLTGYVTDRELTQAVFVFTAASGSNLQTTTLTVPADALFVQYFSGSGATPFGSQFTYTQPFTVTGSTQAIVSVTVTLVNKIGQSAPATATLN